MFMYDVDEQDADVPKYLVVMLAFFLFCLFVCFVFVSISALAYLLEPLQSTK